MRRIRAVFFDAGHTLLYPDPPIGEVYSREARSLGARVDAEPLGRVFADVFKAFVRTYASDMASDAQDRAMWRAITRQVYQEVQELHAIDFEAWFHRLHEVFGHASVWRLYPDVRPAVELLRARGLRLGVISNWDTRLRTIVREMHIESLFDCVIISAEAGVRKPDPKIFQRALAAVGVSPEEALHVGDLVEDDIAGARGAGLQGVLIDRGRDVMANGAPVVRDLRELVRLTT